MATVTQTPSDAPPALILDFLHWIDREPRTYAETLDAWHTSCPRLPVWEEAFSNGLVFLRREDGVRMRETPVVLTPRGRALLDAARATSRRGRRETLP